MVLQNYHTHTQYCDAKNTADEMAWAAYQAGFRSLGFSGHAYTAFDESWCMTQEGTEAYIEEIRNLKRLYRDRLEILLGVEMDLYSDQDLSELDYAIGSVHYLKMPKADSEPENVPEEEMAVVFPEMDGFVYLPVDESLLHTKAAIDRYFGGDAYAFTEKYFEEEAEVIEKTGADIIGHFDLVTKFQEKEKLFDETDPRYVNAWKAAADKLLQTGKVFEINTGAMARGYRTDAYPAEPIREYLKEKGARFILASDAHDAEKLTFAFDKFEEWVK